MFLSFSPYYRCDRSIPSREVKQLNDEKTIQAIQNRSEAAIGQVMAAYSRLLWSVAQAVLHGVGSDQDVEECVADAFIYLWEHPDQYVPRRGKLKTWLVIVARTQALNRCRALARERTVSLEETELVSCLGAAETLLAEEDRKALLAAVNTLGEPDREILLRRYCRDQKPREIALALGLEVKQVDNRLYQAKRKLRTVISH